MPGGRKPSHKREQAVAALLSSPSVAAAAQKAGVSERTLRSWLKDAEFTALYRAARRDIVEAAVTLVQQTMATAAATLHRNLTCGAPAAEIAAAKFLWEQGLAAVSIFDHEQRLQALEAASAARPAPRGGFRP
jgi:hypothetical protein